MLLAPFLDAKNADGADVMMTASVDAAGNFDLEVTHQVLARGQARREALRDGNRARIGKRAVVETGAGDDVGGETGVGLGQADCLKVLIQRPQIAEP